MFFYLMSYLFFTIPSSIEKEFSNITSLSHEEEKICTIAPPYSFDDYLDFALIASGAQGDFGEMKRVVYNLIGRLEEDMFTDRVSEQDDKRAEYILQWLHKHFLSRYSQNQTRIDELISKRTFNCVSSAVFYNIIARKFGLKLGGVVVREHAFSQLQLPKKRIDIETTTQHGFNPGGKKAQFDESGKLIGFVYIPKNHYRQRVEIGDREMLSLIYSNRARALTDKGKYMTAAALLYRSWRLAGKLPNSHEAWVSGLINYIANLQEQKRFSDALYVISAAQSDLPDNKKLAESRAGIYVNWGYEASRGGRYDEAINALKEGVSFFPKHLLLMQNLKAAFLQKIQLLEKGGRYGESRVVLKNAMRFFPKDAAFKQTDMDIFIMVARDAPLNIAEGIFHKGLKKYPNDDYLLQHFALLYIKRALKLSGEGGYLEALELIKRGVKNVPRSKELLEAPRKLYNDWGLSLLAGKDFPAAVKVYDSAIESYPADSVLMNNRDYVISQWASAEFKAGNFGKAIAILKEGLKKSPKNVVFRQNIEYYYNTMVLNLIKDKKYKQAAEYLKSGLNIVPNSKVLNKNLKYVAHHLSKQKD